jgi:hypothetical protein
MFSRNDGTIARRHLFASVLCVRCAAAPQLRAAMAIPTRSSFATEQRVAAFGKVAHGDDVIRAPAWLMNRLPRGDLAMRE